MTQFKTESMDDSNEFDTTDLKEINRQKELDEKYGG